MSQSQMFESNVEDGILIVTFQCEMLTEEDNLELLGQEIQDELTQASTDRLILDVAALNHVTSAVLGKRIHLHRSLHREGGRMIICSTQPPLQVIFTATRLHTFFELADDLQSAKSLLDAT